MSYDLQIWAVVDPVDLAAALPDANRWARQGDFWIWNGGKWQISIYGPDKVQDEDVPEEVRPHLPGIQCLYNLHLEPSGAPGAGHKVLMASAKAIARATHGAILDPQSDEVILPAGIKRFAPKRREREERFDLVSMGWWFTESPILAMTGASALVGLLERMLPEALPRRYGLYEPPQHRYEETGRDHFIQFLGEHQNETIWYPARPIVGMDVGYAPGWGWLENRGFRANRLEINLDATVLQQPGWQTQLSRFWRTMSAQVRPFYGEVRTLGGNLPMGGTYARDMKSEQGPTCSWWWRGVPQSPGYAVVLGDPYHSSWPAFLEKAEHANGLAFVTSAEWKKGASVTHQVGAVPEAISQRWTPEWANPRGYGWSMRWNTEYPSAFPFGQPPPGCLDRPSDF